MKPSNFITTTRSLGSPMTGGSDDPRSLWRRTLRMAARIAPCGRMSTSINWRRVADTTTIVNSFVKNIQTIKEGKVPLRHVENGNFPKTRYINMAD